MIVRPSLCSQIMGLYFAIEIVQHRDDPRHRGISTVDSCPLVQISMIEGSSSFVKLLWDETAGHVEYHFSIPNSDTPGYWMSSGPQNGELNYTYISVELYIQSIYTNLPIRFVTIQLGTQNRTVCASICVYC